MKHGSRPLRTLLSAEQVATRYGLSLWHVYERSRLNQLPLIQHPGSRSVRFPSDWLDAYDEGAVELEVTETRSALGVGRVVRPRLS
jgi:predicted DNA-binding transcriptional regulator AlpA